MPIYEYQTLSPRSACNNCRDNFEILQGINEKPISVCPQCGKKVKKIISWCHASVVEIPEEQIRVKKKIKEYEKSNMWSHAAELEDKQSKKTKDKGLKTRAIENYKRAGYDADSLAKHAKVNDE